MKLTVTIKGGTYNVSEFRKNRYAYGKSEYQL
ncbi:MAG: hypothetical protein PWP51_89 [Clostridiales bacterium]|jgi:hypothetical protein|nr:hypothetical protein [Clostridiales bacterium]